MVKFDFIISNLLLLSKCLSFSDISKDINWLNIYTKDGRVLMASGKKVRVVVDTLINTSSNIDICIDCNKFIEYISYIKNFGKEGTCSLLIKDNVFKIVNNNKNKIKNNLYLEYIEKTTTKIRAKNFNKIASIDPATAKDGMAFVATGADNSEKYSAQTVGVLIESKNKMFRLAGTDGVRCCIYTIKSDQSSDHSIVIPSNTARAISNTASLLDKNANICYSSTYFVCDFGAVVIYSPKINLAFPSLDSLINFVGSGVYVNRNSFINVIRGANIDTKGKQDNKVNLTINNNRMKINSDGFDSTLELDTALNKNAINVNVFLNSLFLYNMCSSFKGENINLQFDGNIIKISDDTGIKLSFMALLK